MIKSFLKWSQKVTIAIDVQVGLYKLHSSRACAVSSIPGVHLPVANKFIKFVDENTDVPQKNFVRS